MSWRQPCFFNTGIRAQMRRTGASGAAAPIDSHDHHATNRWARCGVQDQNFAPGYGALFSHYFLESVNITIVKSSRSIFAGFFVIFHTSVYSFSILQFLDTSLQYNSARHFLPAQKAILLKATFFTNLFIISLFVILLRNLPLTNAPLHSHCEGLQADRKNASILCSQG